jgi:hypothetical protein
MHRPLNPIYYVIFTVVLTSLCWAAGSIVFDSARGVMIFPTGSGPAANGEMGYDGTDIKIYTGGAAKTLGATVTVTPMNMSGGYVSRVGTNLVMMADKGPAVYLLESGAWVAHQIPPSGTVTPCTGLSNSTLYYCYAKDSGTGTAQIQLTTLSAPVTTTAEGVWVKGNDSSQLLVAYCYANASGAVTTYVQDATTQLICNVYNKRSVNLVAVDATDSWSYSTAAWRVTNGSVAGNRLFVVSDGKDAVVAVVHGMCAYSYGNVGVGINATNAASGLRSNGNSAPSASGAIISTYMGRLPVVGYNVVAGLEYGAPGAVFGGNFNDNPYRGGGIALTGVF